MDEMSREERDGNGDNIGRLANLCSRMTVGTRRVKVGNIPDTCLGLFGWTGVFNRESHDELCSCLHQRATVLHFFGLFVEVARL